MPQSSWIEIARVDRSPELCFLKKATFNCNSLVITAASTHNEVLSFILSTTISFDASNRTIDNRIISNVMPTVTRRLVLPIVTTGPMTVCVILGTRSVTKLYNKLATTTRIMSLKDRHPII